MEHITEIHVYTYLELGGRKIPFITDSVVNTWIVMAVIMIAVLVLTRRLETIPRGGQRVVEGYVSLVNGLCKSQIGHHWKPFAPYLGTVLLYLVFSNILGIFNVIPKGETLAVIFNNPALEHFHFALEPPTRDFNVAMCLAVMSVVLVIGAEFRYRGVRGWLRSFYKPTPVSAFIKILDYVVRPISLCLRMFGNILGAVIVMALVYMSMPIVAPAIIGIYFDLIDGGLQAYVFVFLTSLYIAEAVEEEE